jgi:hypothetical protein
LLEELDRIEYEEGEHFFPPTRTQRRLSTYREIGMASKLTGDERALKSAKAENEDGHDFVVRKSRPFLNGALYEVVFKEEPDPEDEDDDENCFCEVYVTGDLEKVFGDYEDIVEYAVDHPAEPKTAVELFLDYGGIAGLIAVIIAVTIAFIVLRNPSDVKIPDVLSNALTTILGFYFGTKVGGDRQGK